MKKLIFDLDKNSSLSSGFAYVSEMIRYLISGLTAFILYWPFGWIFLNFNDFENNDIITVFLKAYQQFPKVSDSWSTIIFFLILPFFGLLNRAIIYTLVETMLSKFCFKDQATCNKGSSSSKKLSKLLCKIRGLSCKIRKLSIFCLSKQFELISYKTINYLESCINPCWQLSGSFEYIDFQEWLSKDEIRNKIWDHVRLMYGIYGSFYLTCLTFMILYILFFVINLLFACWNDQINIVNYLAKPLFFLFILLILTFALYVNYLHHRFDWLAMNVRYYVKYLIDIRTDIIPDTDKKELNTYIQSEQYKELSEKLKATHNKIIDIR